MTDISPINQSYAAQPAENLRGGESRRAGAESAARRIDEADTAEFSERAQHLNLLARLRELPEIRTDLVGRVRAEIAEGRYDTAERLDGAIDGIVREVDLLG